MSGSGGIYTGGGYAGAAWLQSANNPFNALSFLMEQIIAGQAFAALVLVKSVTGGGVSGTPPRVSVQPMVHQTDGLGNLVPHGDIYNIPCFRLQGGTGAVVLDPVVGDIGQAIICDRDISHVKNTAAVSGPGSWRQNDWADGCYFGGFLNSAPTTYVQISASGITVVSPVKITLQAPNIEADASGQFTVNSPQIVLNGQLSQGTGATNYTATLQGPVTVVNDVTAGGKSAINHTHLENGTGHQTNPPT